jgi:hypothetical protein
MQDRALDAFMRDLRRRSTDEIKQLHDVVRRVLLFAAGQSPRKAAHKRSERM